MKKVIFSLAAATLLAYAGKNVAPAPVPPMPIPDKTPKAPIVLPPLGLYLGGGFTYADSECKCNSNVRFSDGSSGTTNSAKTYGVNLKAGYTINEYVALEAKYIYTPWGDKDKTLKHYGIYLKPTAPVNENFDLYGLLGYGKTECETLSESYKKFSWGVGAEYTIEGKKNGMKKGLGVYAEYLRPLKTTSPKDITTNVFSGGLSYHF